MRRGHADHGQMNHWMSGFGKTLAGSIILHAALLAAAAFVYTGANRVFITPVYTVDLLSGPAAQKAKAAPPAQDEARSEPAPPPAAPVEKPRAVEPKKAPPVEVSKDALKVKEKPPLEEALRKIEKRVEQRKNEALVDTSIDELKRKMEASRLSKERVSRLKEELASRAASPPAAPAAKPAQAENSAPGAGAARPSLEERYSAYYGVLRDKVQENWIYPQGLKDNRISIIVSMKIARNGKLIEASVEKSSGNKAFDDSLLKAIKKAAPFPPLPTDLEGNFLETGLRFCPGCMQ